MKRIYGKHLLIDGYVSNPSVLSPDSIVVFFDSLVKESGYVSNPSVLSPDSIVVFFDSLVKVLGMEYLQRPIAVRAPLDVDADEQQDDGGWSYFCQITTSHIAIHTWPLRSAFMMDIFSCRNFDEERAKAFVCRKLDTSRVHVRLIERKDPYSYDCEWP